MEDQDRRSSDVVLFPHEWVGGEPMGTIDPEVIGEEVNVVGWARSALEHYRQGKEIVVRFVGSNLAYSVLYVVLLVTWMIYPMLSILWVLLWRGAVVFAVVCAIRFGQKYVGKYVVTCVKATWSRNGN